MAIRSLKSGTFSRSGMVGNPVIMPGSYESIATVDVGAGGSSTITFSSIPSTYTHLQIRILARGSAANVYGSIGLRFNSDTAANYSDHILGGDGASASAQADVSSTSVNSAIITGGNATASIFGVGIIDILDYANTNKYKTTRNLGANDQNGGGILRFASGSWRSTTAVTSITLTENLGSNFAQYSSFALYGVN